MRIHTLEITGFGPFKNTQKIDFNALTVDRIFMLEGPTGAGKSSIIDAIVWVLYGTTAQQGARKAANDKTGNSEFGDRVHSDFLEPHEETRVVMEFSVNEAKYRVQRTQSFAPKKKGSDELVTKSTQRLEFIEPTAEPVTKDIYVDVYRILQMEVAQFSQLVVMPQAAFDTFLRAKSESRSEVLSKIFRTYFYEKLEKHLSDRGNEIKNSLEAERVSMDHHVRNLGTLASAVNDFDFDIDEEIKFFRSADEIFSRSEKDAHLAEIITRLTPNSTADMAEKGRIEEVLAPITEQITKLNDSIEKIEDKVKKSERLSILEGQKSYFEELAKELDAITKAASFKVLKEAVDDAQATLDDLDEVDEDLEDWNSKDVKDRIKELEPQVKELAAEVAKQSGTKDQLDALEGALSLAESIEEAIKESPKIQKSLDAIKTKIVAQKKKNKDYEAKQSESWVHNAAKKLKKGQPCPVCGSKEHPKPISGKGSFDEDVFAEMIEALEKLEEQESDLKEDLAKHKPFLNKKSKSSAVIKKEITALEKRAEKADSILSEHDEKESELKLLTTNLPRITALENANAALLKANQKFEKALEKAGLDTKSLEELLNASEANIKKEIDDYKEEVTSLTSILSQPEYVSLPNSADTLSAQLEELDVKSTALKNKLEQVDARIALSQDRLIRINTASEGVIDALNNLTDISAREGAVIQLNRLAIGFNKDALSLTNYVLQERLQMILERASLHLLKISNYKFEFKLNEEKGASKKNAGLGITVIDHVAGKERPAETLSGGETFYASLSLCLGLAEVVKMDKGGIELGTLFIDEGFGSLSSDKLSEVLEVLNKMREDGRIIGIITHLEDMKSQIPLRLQVIRSDEGPSYVKMAVGSEI